MTAPSSRLRTFAEAGGFAWYPQHLPARWDQHPSPGHLEKWGWGLHDLHGLLMMCLGVPSTWGLELEKPHFPRGIFYAAAMKVLSITMAVVLVILVVNTTLQPSVGNRIPFHPKTLGRGLKEIIEVFQMLPQHPH